MGTLVCHPPLSPTPGPCDLSLCAPLWTVADPNSAEALGLQIWAAADELMSVTQFVGTLQSDPVSGLLLLAPGSAGP